MNVDCEMMTPESKAMTQVSNTMSSVCASG